MSIILDVPSIVKEGVDAARLGMNMTDQAHPYGYTFCPYRDGSVERYNFLLGCESVYFGLRK
jgi:hypothetical protein